MKVYATLQIRKQLPHQQIKRMSDMGTYTERYPFRNLIIMLVVVGMVGVSNANGEASPQSPGTARNSPQAERTIKKKNLTYQMWRLVRKSDWEGIRTLFRGLDDGPGKMKFASNLMELGVKDEEYFRYLAERAQVAIERDVPFPMKFDENGKVIRGEMSEAFLAWCDKHQIEPGERVSTFIYKDPVPVMILAQSGDPRALPLLLRGLASPNFYIVAKAAHGLGLIGDARAIDPLVQAIEKAPEEVRLLLVMELGYFDHPEAHAALERFIPDPQKRQSYIAMARKALARRKNSPAFVFGDSPIPDE